MEWFENETFWSELYPHMFPPERFAVAAEQADQVVALTKCTGGAALDLCCGPGRHAIALAQRGFAVTGVDRTASLLDRAQERAAVAGVAIEWVMEDMRRFRRPAAFDLVCNLFTSFGYFENEADDLQVLRNIHASLKDGGVLVMEMIGKERLARVWQSVMCTEQADGSLLIQRPKVVKDWCRIENEWIILRDGRAQTFRFEHAVYSGCELRDRLRASGFCEVELFGGLQGKPYDLEATRLVAVARKISP
ncbi:MAG: class I SAM-dependent methyltransferase [Bryobacteraceae bacterium]